MNGVLTRKDRFLWFFRWGIFQPFTTGRLLELKERDGEDPQGVTGLVLKSPLDVFSEVYRRFPLSQGADVVFFLITTVFFYFCAWMTWKVAPFWTFLALAVSLFGSVAWWNALRFMFSTKTFEAVFGGIASFSQRYAVHLILLPVACILIILWMVSFLVLGSAIFWVYAAFDTVRYLMAS